jgi:hypothetical protein
MSRPLHHLQRASHQRQGPFFKITISIERVSTNRVCCIDSTTDLLPAAIAQHCLCHSGYVPAGAALCVPASVALDPPVISTTGVAAGSQLPNGTALSFAVPSVATREFNADVYGTSPLSVPSAPLWPYARVCRVCRLHRLCPCACHVDDHRHDARINADVPSHPISPLSDVRKLHGMATRLCVVSCACVVSLVVGRVVSCACFVASN